MSTRKSILITVVSVAAIAALGAAWIFGTALWSEKGTSAFGYNEIAKNGNIQGARYPGDPVREARLVDQEDERLVYIRTVASAARWNIDGLDGPYRLQTGPTFTLVLPARDQPYTTADLVALAPDTFVLQPGGSYLLSKSLAVLAGATLSLASDVGTEIRLKSDPDSFVSIVALGGSLTLGGSNGSRASIRSWDVAAAAPDTTTIDGRAYVRVLGGHASFSHTDFSDLGFWSGNTGGVALTGTEVASTFSPVSAPTTKAATAVAGAPLLANEEVAMLSSAAAEDFSIVTAGIQHVSFDGNAYGLFITNAKDVIVHDAKISGSLVDGLAVHRNVTDSSITRTTSSDNNVDGFSLDRSSTGVTFTKVTANDNGRNGISLDGQSLADGPNAVGTGVAEYGRNKVTSSTIIGNGRYGIEISGGSDMSVSRSYIAGNEVGVVVNHEAKNVTIASNNFEDQITQAVAVRDGVKDTSVTMNTIAGGDTGVYVRNASATVTSNEFTAISNHGITLVGTVPETSVTNNNVAGYGSKAIRADDTVGAYVGKNELLDWRPAVTVGSVVNSVFQPLTFVWLMLASLVVASAFTRKRQLRVRSIRSPYPEQVPLTSLSRGIMSVNTLQDAR